MKYSGRWGVIIPSGIALSIVLFLYMIFFDVGGAIPAIIIGAGGLFVLVWTFPTYLILEQDFVEVRVGMSKKKMLCSEIVSLQKTRNPASSYALSLDRIKIELAGGQSIMVSLRQNDEFIKKITTDHPHIKYV